MDQSAKNQHRKLRLQCLKQVAADLSKGSKDSLVATITTEQKKLLHGLKGQGFSLVDLQITFDSIAHRNQLAAEHHFEILKDEIGPFPSQQWLTRSNELWQFDDHSVLAMDSVAGRFLALLEEHFELLPLASDCLNRGNVFDILMPISACLRFLKTLPVEHIYTLSVKQDEYTRRDLYRDFFYQKLSAALISKVDVAEEILRREQEGATEITINLYKAAMYAIQKTSAHDCAKLAISNLDSPNESLHSAAYQVLGTLVETAVIDPELNKKIVDHILFGLTSTKSSVQEGALLAVLSCANRTSIFDSLITELVENGSDTAAYYLAKVLWQNWRLFGRNLLLEHTMPVICSRFSGSSIDCTFLDFLLVDLLKEPDHQLTVVKSLENWVENQIEVRSLIKDLDSTISAIINSPTQFSTVLTSWLSKNSKSFGFAAGDLVAHASFREVSHIAFDSAMVDSMTPQTFEYLAYRTIGFIHRPEDQIALVVSLHRILELCDRKVETLRHILLEELGYEVPGLVVEALEREMAIHPSTHLFPEIIDELQKRSKIQKELLPRKEFQVSTRLVRAFSRQRTAEMASAMKQGQSQSVFLKMATKITVKAGTQVFNFQNLPIDQSMQLKELSVSCTIPKSLMLDPVGLELRRRAYMSLKL